MMSKKNENSSSAKNDSEMKGTRRRFLRAATVGIPAVVAGSSVAGEVGKQQRGVKVYASSRILPAKTWHRLAILDELFTECTASGNTRRLFDDAYIAKAIGIKDAGSNLEVNALRVLCEKNVRKLISNKKYKELARVLEDRGVLSQHQFSFIKDDVANVGTIYFEDNVVTGAIILVFSGALAVVGAVIVATWSLVAKWNAVTMEEEKDQQATFQKNGTGGDGWAVLQNINYIAKGGVDINELYVNYLEAKILEFKSIFLEMTGLKSVSKEDALVMVRSVSTALGGVHLDEAIEKRLSASLI